MRAAVIVPDWPLPPNAGRWQLHNLARELRILGIDTVVVGRAYEHSTIMEGAVVLHEDDYHGGEDVVVIVPEGWNASGMEGYFRRQIGKPNAAVVVYVQGWGMAEARHPVETHYWATGDVHRDLVREKMGIPDEMPIQKVRVPVQSFKPHLNHKIKGLLTYYPRRNISVLDKVAKVQGNLFPTYRLAGLSHPEVLLHLARTDIFLLASEKEGQGVSLQEAMLMECAVVTWPSGGLVDTVENEVTGIIVPQGDINGLINAVADLRAYPDKARELGNNARKFVVENFSWELFRTDVMTAWKETVTVH